MSSSALDHAIEAALGLAQSGKVDAAATELREIAIRFPDSSEPWRLIGVLALQNGDAIGARHALEKALRSEPGSPAVLCNLATLASSRGDDQTAVTHYREALATDPANVVAHNNLGGLLFDQGRLAAAESHYRAALAKSPGYAPARANLAACLLALGRKDEAIVEGKQATRDAPEFAPAWLSVARIFHAMGEFERAGMSFERAFALGMRTPDVLYGIAQSADDLTRWPEALDVTETLLAMAPDHGAAASLAQFLRRQLCRHDGIEAGQDLLFKLVDAGVEGISPFAFLSEAATPEQQRRVAERMAREIVRGAHLPESSTAVESPSRTSPGTAADRIRVGFVSSGFGQHPTALLIVDLIERLRGSVIEAIGYATTPDDGGELRQRLGKGFAALHDVSALGANAMASRLRADDLDVAIDLRGWGGGSVAGMFARRPAPIQINWLAYPGTSGAPWIDYLLADSFVVPDAERANYSEALVRLPHCFQPSDTSRRLADPFSRAVLQLPEDATVFACFNNAYKYSPESLQRFWSILEGVPGSVLWLLDGKHGEIRDNLRAAARAAGIAPARLVFLPRQPHESYLASYGHADLFLDTTPYNAHTTASDALWAGCPVLTLPGRTFASRVAGSLNHTLGLDELNAIDDDAFIDTAIVLGRDRAALRALRERLASARATSPLFDMSRFATDFTRAISAMVERRRNGDSPGDFDLADAAS